MATRSSTRSSRTMTSRMSSTSAEAREDAACEAKGTHDGETAETKRHRRLHLEVSGQRSGHPGEIAGDDPPCCARSDADDQLHDACLQAARNLGLFRCVGETHRDVPTDLREQDPGESNRSVRWTEGQSPVSSR